MRVAPALATRSIAYKAATGQNEAIAILHLDWHT